MTYNPLPPARGRNGRPVLSPVFVRPSGDAGSFSIGNFPFGAQVFVDGLPVTGGSTFENTMRLPYSGEGRVLRVVTPAGEARELDLGGLAPVRGGDYDWNTMTPVASADTAPPTALVVQEMPHGGRVFVNDAPVDGAWTDASQRAWRVPLSSPVLASLRVTDAAGAERRRTDRTPINLSRGVAYVNWNELDADEGSLRVFGAPHTQLWVRDVLQPRPDAGAGGVLLYPRLPTGTYAVRLVAEDGFTWTPTVTIRAGETTQVPLVRPAAPAPGTIRVPVILPTAPVPATLALVGAREGWTAALARVSPAPQAIGAVAFPASGAFTQPGLPPGTYTLLVGRGPGDTQQRTLTLAPGATLTENVGAYFPPATLTVSGTPGLLVGIAHVGSTVPLVPVVALPASGAMSVPWQPGRYDLGVSNGVRAVKRTIEVPPAGLAIDVRDWIPAETGPVAGTPGNLTVTGTAGWVLTLTPAGSATAIHRLPILAGGTVAFPVPAGSYTLKVEDGAGHTASQAIDVGATGAAVDVTPWLAAQLAPTQGPTMARAGLGTIVLTGSPPGALVRVAGVPEWRVDDTGRPVAMHVTPTQPYAVTVTPPSGPVRSGAVTPRADAEVTIAYGSLVAPSSVTAGDSPGTLQTVDQMCGPIAGAPSWAPASACPGQVLTAPDGTRYAVSLAPAGQTGVVITQLKPDGTPVDAGWSTGTMLLVGGAVVAAAGAAWWFYGRDAKDSKTENPGRAKCSCGGHG